ncbi:hypothetical protein C8A03DRAFT_45208 [Achaetomium macrosporum]|uniref:NB-ARC domain-containing protein n=1 Tax=Achaetomium macrosporum TaxID=79813 RepID=A0AAN7C7H6_9PEZI|nr:hypothetical protein C8A03DRAFT_45208 [Achaetomium macrosporum]
MGHITEWAAGSSDASSSDPASVPTDQAGPLTPGNVPPFPDGVGVWHDNPDATVDICFVHGLTGNRESTWTAHGQSVPWPKTFLPSKLRNARLLTYGYDAYVVRKSVVSTNRLIDHASNLLNDLCNESSRPLIFVAHSLGGLVCKEAILLSQHNPEPHLRGIFDRVMGIVFMGTPHKGSWMASWARIPASTLGLFKSNNTSLLAILETENQLLESIQGKFLSMVRGIQKGDRSFEITCFFEELPLSVVGHVVSRDSATIEGYTSISVHANHRDMVRFTSPEDTGFQRLLGDLEEPVRYDSARPCHYIPFPKNKRFVGREETLHQLRDMFFVQEETQKIAVVGLGGVGKTQVALKFAYWVKDNKPEYSIFWVPALSRVAFEQAYVEMASKLPIRKRSEDEDLKESVRRYLSSEAAGPWLLIVDNTDDIDLFFGPSDKPGGLNEYLPESEDGLVLFTTRSREVAVAVARNSVTELLEMDPQEAADYLKKSLIRSSGAGTAELLKELTYLPLAITQAAAYLNTTGVPITEYLRLLRGADQDTASLMSREFHDDTRYRGSPNAVATTWLVSFDQICKSDGAAADLLSFMSCIEPKGIPQSILPRFELEEQMVHAVGTLCGYAFLTRRGDSKIFDMHSLVHLATRIWIQGEGRTATIDEKATRHLATVFPDDDYTNCSLWREYLPHAFRVLQHSEGLDMEERSNLCFWVGRCLRVDGRIKEAIRYVEEACQWRNSHFAEDHPSRLASQHVLAMAYNANGRVKEAVALLEQVVAIQAKTFAEDHPDRLASQHALAGAYRANGQVKEAIALLEQVVTIKAKTLAEDHPSRLASQHVLAGAYNANGQVKEAVALLEQVVAIRAETLAEDHPDRLASQHVLAGAYNANGQVKEAVALLEQVVTIEAKTLAEDHPDRLASQHELARAYRANGQVKEAVALLEQVVAIQAETFAEDHPSRLASQHVLAGAYNANGRVKEAIALLEQVVAIKAETFAEDHPDRLASQHALAGAYNANGQVKEAIALLEQVVAIQAETLAEDHPDRLASQQWLTYILQQADLR